jgi:hypothetical protein
MHVASKHEDTVRNPQAGVLAAVALAITYPFVAILRWTKDVVEFVYNGVKKVLNVLGTFVTSIWHNGKQVVVHTASHIGSAFYAVYDHVIHIFMPEESEESSLAPALGKDVEKKASTPAKTKAPTLKTPSAVAPLQLLSPKPTPSAEAASLAPAPGKDVEKKASTPAKTKAPTLKTPPAVAPLQVPSPKLTPPAAAAAASLAPAPGKDDEKKASTPAKTKAPTLKTPSAEETKEDVHEDKHIQERLVASTLKKNLESHCPQNKRVKQRKRRGIVPKMKSAREKLKAAVKGAFNPFKRR